ncbi:MAG: bifunctional DNA primase/polymerase [Phycisphaerae bacterium]|nr:bifunctional DNA primase/polymerase [Phycisphaerae bacterium]
MRRRRPDVAVRQGTARFVAAHKGSGTSSRLVSPATPDANKDMISDKTMPSELCGYVEYGHGLGWSFTPLNGKRPVLTAWQKRPHETLTEALAWAAKGNVGLRTGRSSGIVVIDVDEGGDISGLGLSQTVTVNTGGNGTHLYYRCSVPLGNSSGRLGPHIDVRGDGGQVVFPGSLHPDTGALYTWADGLEPWNVEITELPVQIIDRLKAASLTPGAARLAPVARSSAKATHPSGKAERYAQTAMKLELNAVYTARDGTRNETLNRAAFSLGTLIGGGYLDRGEVEETLRNAAESVGLDAREIDATIRSGIESGIKQPRVIPDRPPSVEASVNQERPIKSSNVPALPVHRFRHDLYGNADRFMHLFGQDVHWCDERGKWYVWDGRIWKPDALREVSRFVELTMRAIIREAADDPDVLKWATACNKGAKAARETLEVIKHRTAIDVDAMDQDRWLLGVENGVIDLRSGELLPHDRQRMISVLCPTTYDPDTPCERWLQFLAEIMAGDDAMIEALQRMAGYFLTGDISEQILPIFYGPGSNGKNVFLDTITGIMGPHAAEAPDGLVTTKKTDEHPTEIADLFGKRLVVASETEEGKKLRIGLVKKITGNKYLKGRFMRRDYFQFERTHKTVLVTNNKPVITETSNAIWRRLRLIPFEVTIPKARQDKHLTDKLVAEWPGILAWAVRGCLAWQQHQCDLALPEAVVEATEAYRSDSDHVADFVAERCNDWRRHPEQKMKTPKERVYSAYCTWCRDIGEDVLSRTSFNKRMRGQGFVDKTAKTDRKAQKCWIHITLDGKGRVE